MNSKPSSSAGSCVALAATTAVSSAGLSMHAETSPTDGKPRAVLRIGIDFGGVLSRHDIFKHRPHDPATVAVEGVAVEHKNVAIDAPGALEALKEWKARGHELYLISFCGRTRAEETRASIERTSPGLFTALYFTRSTSAKADICRHLGCHIMIDDRKDILVELKRRVPEIKRYWFEGRETEWSGLRALISHVQSDDMDMKPQPLPVAALKKLLYL
jgi:hypothetical protein